MAAPATPGSRATSAGTWHPRSSNLAGELPPLLAEMRRRGLHVRRVTFPLTEWDDAARKVYPAGDLVRLGGFHSMAARTVRLTGAGDQALVLDVVPAETPAPRSHSTGLRATIATLVEGQPPPAPRRARRMTVHTYRTHEQIHLDAELAARATRRRAVQTVRANVPDLADQQELLAALGLLDDLERPVDLPVV